MLKVDIDTQMPLPSLLGGTQLVDWAQLAYVSRGNKAGTKAEVAIAVVDEEAMRELNKTYRNIDKSTNVLAFPAQMDPVDGIVHLGDIIMCAPIIEAQALEQSKKSAAHWAHMVIHGMLHLQGYDHEQSLDANKMESLEIELLAKIALPNPYE